MLDHPRAARYFHELLVSLFREARVSPVHAQYLSQVHSILALVACGWGLALVPAAASRLRYAGEVFRPVDLPDPAPVELSLAWRRGNDNPALGRACCCATCDHQRRLDGVRGLA